MRARLASVASRYHPALHEARVELAGGLGEGQRTRFGILLFDEPNGQVHRLLRDGSRGGQLRILAVAVGRPLRSGEVWGLLDAGAADVLPWDRDRDSAECINLWC